MHHGVSLSACSPARKSSAAAGGKPEWQAVVREDGTLAVQESASAAAAKKPAWKSDLSPAAKAVRQFGIKAVLEPGALKVYRSGELAWSSAA